MNKCESKKGLKPFFIILHKLTKHIITELVISNVHNYFKVKLRITKESNTA